MCVCIGCLTVGLDLLFYGLSHELFVVQLYARDDLEWLVYHAKVCFANTHIKILLSFRLYLYKVINTIKHGSYFKTICYCGEHLALHNLIQIVTYSKKSVPYLHIALQKLLTHAYLLHQTEHNA